MTQRTSRIKVWDLQTRLFHWSLLALFGFSWWSGETGGNAMVWHMRSGYAILVLVLFRVGWGFVGSDTARFRHFLRGPTALRAYWAALRRGNAETGAGHNPLGGLMILALLASLLLQIGTGLFANDDIANEGPLAHRISKELSDRLAAGHEWAFNIVLGLTVLHIVAILFYARFKKENLVRPMLTGWRSWPADTAPALRFAGHGRALIWLAACVGAVYALLRWA